MHCEDVIWLFVDLRDAVFLDKLGNNIQDLLCPLAHTVTDSNWDLRRHVVDALYL